MEIGSASTCGVAFSVIGVMLKRAAFMRLSDCLLAQPSAGVLSAKLALGRFNGLISYALFFMKKQNKYAEAR
jgi:hypothetical protein